MINDNIHISPRVSVVIPLYNKASYVTKALDSVLAQTYTDYECIIVNDGSTDNSAEVVEQWLSRLSPSSPTFTVITQPNAGVSAARNRGIVEAKGEYIAFLDADDWWTSTFLEEMMHLVEACPDAGLYACNYIYYKPGKTRVGVKLLYDRENHVQSAEGWSGYINYPKSYFANESQVVWTGATIIPKTYLEYIKSGSKECFPVGIRLGEDFLTWCRIAMQYKVAFVNWPLAYYNNDVPASARATRNLHAPEYHMLWHLNGECEMLNAKCKMQNGECEMLNAEDWKLLLDQLRVTGLMPYWMDRQYHATAAAELSKVDWAALSVWPQAAHYRRQYALPLWLLRLRNTMLTIGSLIKCKMRAR